MSGTLQIVGPGSVSKDGPAVVALTVSATCGLWRSGSWSKVQVQVQVGAGGCRHRLQQVGGVAGRQTGRQMDRQASRLGCVSRWERCSLRNRKWTRGKKRSVIVQDKRED